MTAWNDWSYDLAAAPTGRRLELAYVMPCGSRWSAEGFRVKTRQEVTRFNSFALTRGERDEEDGFVNEKGSAGESTVYAWRLIDETPLPPVPEPNSVTDLPKREWLRADRLLYTLEQIGWHRGDPIHQNRLMVRVDGGPNTPAEEVEALVARLQAVL